MHVANAGQNAPIISCTELTMQSTVRVLTKKRTLSASPVSVDEGMHDRKAAVPERRGPSHWLAFHVTSRVSESSQGSQPQGEMGPPRPFLQLSGKDLSKGI